MKKIILLFLSILVIVSLIGCVTPSEPTAELAPTPVITPSSTLEPTVKSTEQPTPEITATPVTTITPTAEPTPTATPEPTPVPTPEATLKHTPKPTVKPTAKPAQKPSTSGTSSKPTVVQKANINTGISWDGKSAIVYTYPDGSTGTEKRVGAKYEAYPGVIYTIEQSDVVTTTTPPSATFNPVCSHCGRVGKDGTNGTCLRYWTGGDHICKNCGVTVPVKTCHTCSE